jgi:hypothetical protein
MTVQVGEVGAWLLLPLIFLVATVLSSPLIFSASLQTLLDIFVSQRTIYPTLSSKGSGSREVWIFVHMHG